MHIEHEMVMDCSEMTQEACSDICIEALTVGHGSDFKLKADTEDDIVHGFVTIVHNDPPLPHEYTVEIYEVDEPPTAKLVHGELEGRLSTFKRPETFPTEQVLKDRLDTLKVS